MTIFNMKSIDDEMNNTAYFTPGSYGLDPIQRRNILLLASEKIVSTFVDLSYCAREGKKN